MIAGWLALNYITLLYTRVPYEMHTETAFEIIKHLWFLECSFEDLIQTDIENTKSSYVGAGDCAFHSGNTFPGNSVHRNEEAGAEVIRMHIRDDFNEEGMVITSTVFPTGAVQLLQR